MTIQYKAYEFRIYNLLCQFDQLLEEIRISESYPVWKEKISNMRENLEKRTFRVAVLGEFNRGKTSFVNVLLGKKILPEDYVPTTAVLNRITYSDKPSSYVIFKDGQKKNVQISDLAEYVTKLTKESTQTAAEIREAVVEYPSLLCRNGVDLIDTPGMNDEDAMNVITLSKLEEIDLALVALDPSMPFSMTECSFTLRLLENPQVSQIVFIVTKIDMLRARERERAIKELIKRIQQKVKEELSKCHGEDSELFGKYHEIFDHLHIFPVSSTEAMDALSCSDMDAYKKSGFWELNNRLPDIIMISQNKSTILTPVREMQMLLKQVRLWAKKKGQEQNEQLKSCLESLFEIFSAKGNEGISNVFVQAEQGIGRIHSQPENIASLYMDSFEQAFKKIQDADQNDFPKALKKAFVPVIRKLYQKLNQVFYQKEVNYLTQYQKGTLLMQGRWIGERLDKILYPYPGMQKVMQAELSELSNCFSFYDIENRKEFFFWTKSPIPDLSGIEPDKEIMPYVWSSLNISIADYLERRSRELKQMARRSQKRLEGQFEKCREKLLAESQQTCERGKKKWQDLNKRITSLEEKNSELADDFMRELHGG